GGRERYGQRRLPARVTGLISAAAFAQRTFEAGHAWRKRCRRSPRRCGTLPVPQPSPRDVFTYTLWAAMRGTYREFTYTYRRRNSMAAATSTASSSKDN